MNTSELIGPALDWAVAKCEGRAFEAVESFMAYHDDGEMCYSTNWSQSGPIIEREGINLQQFKGHPCRAFKGTVVHHEFSVFAPEGKPLIAAMRCYVASYLGDAVDIPQELTNDNS